MESKLDLEAEYDNRTLVPEHVEILPRWEKEAAEFRATHSPETLRYGAAERNLVDVFRSAEAAARRAQQGYVQPYGWRPFGAWS